MALAVPPLRQQRPTHRWRLSELASHIKHYGVWIQGTPDWLDDVQIGQDAIREKRRRVEAYMRYLPESWSKLDEAFRKKYSIKVRREAQRLLLLNRNVPIPPTRMLGAGWAEFSSAPSELDELLVSLSSRNRAWFSREFLARVDLNLRYVG